MKIKSVAKNQTELTFNMHHGVMTVFFSYETPVAYVFDSSYAKKTSTRFSSTTERHINAFFGRYGFNSRTVETIPQKDIDSIIK